MRSLKSQKKKHLRIRRMELKARFLTGANTTGEPWSRVYFAIAFTSDRFWVSFNLLSNGWANREAVSSGLSGRRAKLLTHIQLVVRLTIRGAPSLPFSYGFISFYTGSTTSTFYIYLQYNSIWSPSKFFEYKAASPRLAYMTNTCLLQILGASSERCTRTNNGHLYFSNWQSPTLVLLTKTRLVRAQMFVKLISRGTAQRVINSSPVQHKITGASVKYTSRGMGA